MKRLPKLILMVILVPWLLWNFSDIALGETSEEKRVESVEIQLDIDGKIYEGLQERIEFSIGRVGEKILLSQPLSLLEQNEKNVKLAMFNVFSKVLTGFKTESVDLFLGTHTKVLIRLAPQPPFISKINIRLNTQGVTPEMTAFIEQIGTRAESELDKIFVGLPVASMSWADGIFAMVIEYIVEREFPGFKTACIIKPGITVDLGLRLVPNGRLVNDVSVDYNSTTIPTWIFYRRLKSEQKKFDILKGVPVDFLLHYQPDVEQLLVHEFNDFTDLKLLGLDVALAMKPSDKTNIDLLINSRVFRLNLAAKMYFGDEDYNYLQGYLGYRFSDYQVYSKLIWGDSPGGHTKFGLTLPISSNFYGGFEHEMENHFGTINFHYSFERGDYLDLKVGIDDAPSEATIGIHLNEHLNLEMLAHEDDYGIQFNFNFW